MSKKKRKKGKISGEGDRSFGQWPFDLPPLEVLPDSSAQHIGQPDHSTTDRVQPAPKAAAAHAPLSPEHTALTMRFIDTLERQLEAKDEQLRQMDARLQDAFDMQRALALIVRQFEQRTGISSDVLWDQVPEEELERQPAENPGGPESSDSATSGNAAQRHEARQENAARSFDEWLGDLSESKSAE